MSSAAGKPSNKETPTAALFSRQC